MIFDTYEETKLRLANRAREESREAIKANIARQKAISEEVDYRHIMNKLASLKEHTTTLLDFRKSVTDAFVTEGLTIFVDNCVNPVIIKEEYNQKLVRQLVSAFVNEEGSTKLLNRMKRTSNLLSELAYVTEKSIKSVLEKADGNNDETFKIDDTDKKTFYDDLSKMDVDKSIDKITERVNQETKTFIEDNIKEKERIKSVTKKTADKVDESKSRLEAKQGNSPKAEETEQKIQEGYIELGKDRIMEIKANRTKTVFECMVYNLSKSAMINESANKVFVENSKLNMDKIVEHCEVLYTFLVAMDSVKLINVNEEYIQTMLNDLKG